MLWVWSNELKTHIKRNAFLRFILKDQGLKNEKRILDVEKRIFRIF